ncbi:MAG: oligosaccharide flippase family protein [Phycisphaerae bacterium]|nr:oligosaccharide flippase family protein [Phycisphaerae bacterium]MDD5380277.1 oligosaccharide flippase family protein [Phycisphaerae bacterium]
MLFQGLTQATQLIIGIVLVRLISKETLGSYRQVLLVYGLLTGILTIQIESSLYYFLPKYGPEKRRNLVAQTLLITGIISLLTGLAMFFSAGLFAKQFNNPEIAPLIKIFACFPFFDRIVQLIPSFLISLDKALFSGLYSMFNSILMILTVVMIFALGYGIAEALWSKILIGAIFAVIGTLMMIYFSPFGQWHINKSLLLEQLNYCWPLMATTTIGIVNLKLDGILISYYFSKEVYAVYSTGALELPLIALFTASLSSAIMPNMVVEAEKGRLLNSLNLWHEATRKSSLLIFPTFAFFLVCGYDFIVLMYTQAYSQAAWPFLIYLARLPIRVAIYGAIFRAIGYTKPIAIAALLSFIVNAFVSVILLFAGRHGFLSYIGPSIGTFCGSLAAVLFMLVVLRRKINVGFGNVMRWKDLGRILGLSLFCGVLLWLIPVPVSNLLIKLIIRFIIYVGLFFTSLALTKSIHADEWELLRMPLAMIRKTIGRKKPLK